MIIIDKLSVVLWTELRIGICYVHFQLLQRLVSGFPHMINNMHSLSWYWYNWQFLCPCDKCLVTAILNIISNTLYLIKWSYNSEYGVFLIIFTSEIYSSCSVGYRKRTSSNQLSLDMKSHENKNWEWRLLGDFKYLFIIALLYFIWLYPIFMRNICIEECIDVHGVKVEWKRNSHLRQNLMF